MKLLVLKKFDSHLLVWRARFRQHACTVSFARHICPSWYHATGLQDRWSTTGPYIQRQWVTCSDRWLADYQQI